MVGKSRKTPVSDADILASYARTHSGQATARELGIGSSTVHRVLMRENVPRVGLALYRQGRTRFRGVEHLLRAAYDAGATHDELREAFGHASDWAIKAAIKRAGGTLRDNPAPRLKPGELNLVRRLNAEGLGQMAISLALGRSQSFISRLMRRNGILTHLASGPDHSMWKGGRSVRPGGYVSVWMPADDPFAEMRDGHGYVLEHRLVMARKLGRPLRRSETVHHINGDNSDNRPENLQLRQGRHGKHIAMQCLDCGSTNVGAVPLK